MIVNIFFFIRQLKSQEHNFQECTLIKYNTKFSSKNLAALQLTFYMKPKIRLLYFNINGLIDCHMAKESK